MIKKVFTEVHYTSNDINKFKPHRGKYVVLHSCFNGMEEFIIDNKSDLKKFIKMLDNGDILVNINRTMVIVDINVSLP